MKRATGFAAILALSLSACSLAGSRAKTGSCPEGEVCSDETPNGLFFAGPALGDAALDLGGSTLPTARGGKQTITVLTGASLGSPKFEGEFDAEVATTNDIMEIDSVAPPDVVVSGVHLGSAFLRLLEPGTDILLDRVQLAVDAIATADAFPAELALVPSEPFALLANADVILVARLKSSGGGRLIDESTTMTGDGVFARLAWDSFRVHTPPADFDVQVNAGDGSFTDLIPVVTSVDDIELVPISGPKLEVRALSSTTACFVARHGTIAVAGASWTFGASGGASTEKSFIDLPGCIDIVGQTPGTATFTASASGKTVTFSVDVLPSTMAVRFPGAFDTDTSAAAGERALGVFLDPSERAAAVGARP